MIFKSLISVKDLIGTLTATSHLIYTAALPNNLIFIFFPSSGFQQRSVTCWKSWVAFSLGLLSRFGHSQFCSFWEFKLEQPWSACQAPPKGHCKVLQLLFQIFIATYKTIQRFELQRLAPYFWRRNPSAYPHLLHKTDIFSLAEKVASFVFTFQRGFRGLMSMICCWDISCVPKSTDPADFFVNISLESGLSGMLQQSLHDSMNKRCSIPKATGQGCTWETQEGWEELCWQHWGKAAVLSWHKMKGQKFKMAVTPMWINKFRME